MNKIVKMGIISCFLFLMLFNITIDLRQNNNEDISLALLSKVSFADSEFANCLGNYIYESGKKGKAEKRCYREKEGPDTFEGFVYSCEDGGPGCQPTYCSDQTGCYTTDI